MFYKWLLVATFAIAFGQLAHAWIARAIVDEHSGYRNKCYDYDDSDEAFQPLVVPVGAKLIPPPGHCYEISCSNYSDPGKFMVTYVGCGTVSSSECAVTENRNLLFPDCCPKIEC